MSARILIGIGLGVAVGGAVGLFMKSRGGTCPITCNPIGSAVLGGVIGLLVSMSFGQPSRNAFADVEHFQAVENREQFDKLLDWSEKLVLVDFYRPDCPPCRRLAPVLGKLSHEFEGRVEFVKVNVYDAEELARGFGLRGVPTVVMFSHSREIARWVGYLDEDAARKQINAALEKHLPTPPLQDDTEEEPQQEEETMTSSYNVTFKGNPMDLIGDVPGVGSDAPDATLADNDLQDFTLSSLRGKVVVLATAPSLDTPVCSTQTRKFNDAVGELGDNVVVVTVTMDLPFAQKRWCGAEGAENVITLSDHRTGQFGKAYGVLIDGLRLLARSVFVVDAKGDIQYVEVVPEMTDEPNYEAALQAVRQVTS